MLCTLFVVSYSTSWAQVSSYSFSQFAGTYTEITGGTALFTGTTDDAISPATPIGFTFNYNGTDYTTIKVNSNGWASFGTTTSTTTYTPLSSTGTHHPCLAPLGRDLQGGTTAGEIRIETSGVAPNQICTIQWKNFRRFAGTQDFNFQIKLYESTNVIEFVYGTMVATTSSSDYDCGITGATNADYNARTTTTDWSASAAATSNANNMTISATVFPVSGQTYAWNPPPATPPTPFQVAPSTSCVTGTDLDVAGTPAPDVVWYWQTSATGTDMTAQYVGPYNVTANGTYYLRAYNTVTMAWSINSSSYTVTDMPLAADPPAPVADQSPACNSTQITVAAAPAGTEYYWQGNMPGTSNADPATAPYTVTSTDTYYVTAYDVATQCWSNSVGVSVVINTTPLPVPTVTNPVINACTGSNPINLTASLPSVTCSSTASAGGSDSDPVTVTVNDFSCATGTIVSATLDASIGPDCSFGWYSYSVIVNGSTILTAQCDQTGIDLTPYLPLTSVVLVSSDDDAFTDPITLTATVNLTYFDGSLLWYDASTGGNLLGSGTPLNAVGTTVLPDPNVTGTYDFYVASTNGCESTRELVQVVIADVLVDLTPIDETCTNYNNGSFSLTGVTCGAAPFTYSLDGGATYGAIPTDLTAGTYSVIVQDNGGLFSAPVDVVIATGETNIPLQAQALDTIVYACTGDLSIPVNATGFAMLPNSLTTTFAAGNGCGAGNMFDIAANVNDVIITGFDVNAGSAGPVDVYYIPGGYVGNATNQAAWTLVGNYSVAAAGAQFIDVADFTIPAGATYGIYVQYDADYTTGANTYSNADITIICGNGLCTPWTVGNANRTFNGTVYYDAQSPAPADWYDAPSTASNFLGTGSPLETVGTTVLPAATEGVYNFYAYSNNNGCFSVDPLLIEVNVHNVNVDLDSIDASCNNQANGSFVLSNVTCGAAPFSYSVDGGAFGPAPTDLTPGVYAIIVQDNNGDTSGVYYVTVEDADAPTNLYMDTITDQGGIVAWVANGTETEWYVEWGLPGFTPGTGTEIGSATATDTFYLITGLDGNTNYDVYVAANCGPTEVVGDWSPINFTTECGIYSVLPFFETFEDNSETRVCWKNEQEVGTANWTYQTGAGGGTVTTAYEGTLNARFVSQSGSNSPITKLVSPRFDFSGQDSVALVFAYAQESWGTQNITKVYVNSQTSPWTEIQSYNNNVNTWTIDTLFLSDTVYQIAFEGINNWGRANVVDDVQFLPCTLVPGTDGAVDVCRADGTVDLNSVITAGESFGKWYFQNQTFIINDTVADISLLPAGTHYFYYIVETPCAADTTVAAITVFNASSAGQDGTIDVCMNEPFDLLSGLSGNVDLGGTWYDPSNQAMPTSQIMASNIPGQFNYDYIVSNGVCGPDTANVVVNVSPTCDWLNIAELGLGNIDLYPNPTTDMIYITNEGSTEVFSYELTDLNGKVIATKANAINGTETTSIDLGKLEPGVYLIKVANENVEHTFRVIKQ